MMLRGALNLAIHSPITPSEFRDLLFPNPGVRNSIRDAFSNPRYGIAVSGGVDSMALAWLCSRLVEERKQLTPGRLCQFHAFIVDHKAREGSSDEARITKQRLHGMGIKSSILSIEWPSKGSPLDLPDFESRARCLRYQALGNACRQELLVNLLLAHHEDDQAETVLMRLATGHKPMGLMGMAPCATLPECWGMHGVNRSGQFESAAFWMNFHKQNLDSDTLRREEKLKSIPTVEEGGIGVLRPFIHFSKERLISTCVVQGVGWSEDSTNKDAWRNPRNAVRQMMQSAQLPRILQKDSLLSLERRMLDKNRVLFMSAEKLLLGSEVLTFDARSGTLIVRLPRIQKEVKMFGMARWTLEDLRLTAALLLRLLTENVTPHEKVPLQALGSAVNSIFPGLSQMPGVGNVDVKTYAPGQPFTLCGVQFRRLESPLLKLEAGQHLSEIERQRQDHLDPDHTWSLTRQPHHFPPTQFTVPPTKSPCLPPLHLLPKIPLSRSDPSQGGQLFQLWDGRYWIRVLNRMSTPLVVRAFRPIDMQPLRKSLSKDHKRRFDEVLRNAAPGKIRWTLPAIAEAGYGMVLALPTLGKAGIFDIKNEDGAREVEWEIRYKHVSLGRRDDNGLNRDMNTITTWLDD